MKFYNTSPSLIITSFRRWTQIVERTVSLVVENEVVLPEFEVEIITIGVVLDDGFVETVKSVVTVLVEPSESVFDEIVVTTVVVALFEVVWTPLVVVSRYVVGSLFFKVVTESPEVVSTPFEVVSTGFVAVELPVVVC